MKNIILLSDGTGNGAAKRHRTNVWRLYNTLDLHREDQMAFYDDGVGSQEFLPFKLLGGIFGWGLKRNVIELYMFLCRNYQPGDRIYLFGFSRGAFTVRVLAGLLDHCGLIYECKDEQALKKLATQKYNSYRFRYPRGYLSIPFRRLGEKLCDLFNKAPFCGRTIEVEHIDVIGVWDTVDAYGLPIDELAILWDRFIYPMRFPDAQLSTKVKKAYHALSIDDERLTFHPLLWDESSEQKKDLEDRVIQQVWFAGVHSDVGGGYPMNHLAHVSLDWMISNVEFNKATDFGLHFIKELRDQIKCHSDWHGKQHDSRAGLAAYYRYKPRNLAQLCNDSYNGITIDLPKIHRAVMERIKGNVVSYAPTGLPAKYEIVITPKKLDDPATIEQNVPKDDSVPVYEKPPENTQREQALNAALDIIFWRRWLYAALLVATLVLLASRFFLDRQADGICQGAACAIDPLIQLVMNTLPDFASAWFEALRQNPGWLGGFVLVFIFLLWLRGNFWRMTQEKAITAWATLKEYGSPPQWQPTLTAKIRENAHSTFRTLIRWSGASFVLAVILYLLLAIVGHTSFYLRSTLGQLCENSQNATTLNKARDINFDISEPCFGTGILFRKDQKYQIIVKGKNGNKQYNWRDGSFPGGPEGLQQTSFIYTLGVPLRREIAQPWFKLMGRIHNTGNEQVVIGEGIKEYQAKSDGELFLFVNDAVLGFLPNWALPYAWRFGRNQGQAKITVTPIPHE